MATLCSGLSWNGWNDNDAAQGELETIISLRGLSRVPVNQSDSLTLCVTPIISLSRAELNISITFRDIL